MTKVKASIPAKDFFEFTFVGEDKKKLKISPLQIKNTEKLNAIVNDALRHLDKSRGKNVTIVLSTDEKEYTLKHKKVVEQHVVGEEIHPLDQFFHRKVEKGVPGKADSALNKFFHLFTIPFKQISNLWHKISGSDERALKLDVSLLQEINHSYIPGDKLSRTTSLKYIIQSLKKERSSSKDDAEMLDRLELALENSQLIDQLRKKYAKKGELRVDSDFKKVLKSFKDQIIDIQNNVPGSKLLLPVGYAQDGSDEEFFLEISKTNNTYTLHLISQDDKEDGFFSKGVQDKEVVSRSLRYNIENVTQEDLFAKISTLVEYQVNPKIKAKKSVVGPLSTLENPQSHFYTLFKFDNNATFVETPLKEHIAASKSQGQARTLISYINTGKDKGVEERRDLALRLNAFLDVTEKSDRWLKNHHYREVVLNTSATLIDLIEQHRETLFVDDATLQNEKVDLILSKIKAARAKIQNSLPEETKISSMKLSDLKSDDFEVSTSKDIPALTRGELTVLPFKNNMVVFNPDQIIESLEKSLDRFKQIKNQSSGNLLDKEMGHLVRPLIQHTDKLTALSQEDFDKAYELIQNILQIYHNKVSSRRDLSFAEKFNSLFGLPHLPEKKSPIECLNMAALLIISSKMSQEKLDRTADKSVYNNDTHEAPARSLAVAKWMIGHLQNATIKNPLNLKPDVRRGLEAYDFSGPHEKEFLDLCESYINISTMPKDFCLGSTILYPKTEDPLLALSLETFKQAHVARNTLLYARDLEKNPNEFARRIKSIYPQQIEYIREVNSLLPNIGVLSPATMRPPMDFKLRDRYEDYSDAELYYLYSMNQQYHHAARSVASKLYFDFRKKDISRAELKLQADLKRLRHVDVYWDFMFEKNTLRPFETSNEVTLPENVKQYMDQELTAERNYYAFGSKSYPDWAANPQHILPGFAAKYSKDILQDLIVGKVSSSSDNHAVRAENLLLCFAKHPELFEDSEMCSVLKLGLHATERSSDSRINHSYSRIRLATATTLFHPVEEKSNFAFLAEGDSFSSIIHSISDPLLRAIKQNHDANKQDVSSAIIDFMETLRLHTPDDKKGAFDLFFTKDDTLQTALDMQLKLLTDVSDAKGVNYRAQKNIIASRILDKAYREIYLAANPEALLTDAFLTKMMIAFAHYEDGGGTTQLKNVKVSKNFNDLKNIVYGRQEKLLKNNDELAHALVSSTLSSLMPDLNQHKFKWKVSPKGFPVFEATRGMLLYQFDIERGILYKGGAHSEILPNCLRAHEDVQRLFGTSLDMPWIKQSTVEPMPFAELSSYVHPEDSSVRVLLKYPLDEQGQSTGAAPKIRIERKSSKTGEWMSYHRYEIQSDLSATDLPSNIASAIGQKECWIGRAGTKIEISEGPDLYATLTLDKPKSKVPGEPTVSRVISFERVDGQNMLSMSPQLYERLGTLSHPGDVTVFGKNGRAKTIEYSKLILGSSGNPLSYVVRNGAIESVAHTGYRLAPLGEKVSTEALPIGFTSYHLLDKDGAKKVLIPFAELQRSHLKGETYRSDNEAERNEAYAITELTRSITPRPLFEFTLNEKTQKLEIFKPEGDAYLFLAYIAFANHDYKLANFYLTKSHSNNPEMSTYAPIFEMIANVQDRSVSGTAFRLKVAIAKERVIQEELHTARMRGKEAVDSDQEKRIVELLNLYDAYEQSRKSSIAPLDKDFKLTSDEKKLISPHLDKNKNITKETVQTVSLVSNELLVPPISLPFLPMAGSELLWLLANDSSKESHLENHSWMTQNFHATAQKILAFDKDSTEFKEFATQMRATLITLRGELMATLASITETIPESEVKISFDDDIEIVKRPPINNLGDLLSFKKLKESRESSDISIQATTLSLLGKMLDHKEAGHLDHLEPLPDLKRPSNVIFRLMKIAKMGAVSSLLGIPFQLFDVGNTLPASVTKEFLLEKIKPKEDSQEPPTTGIVKFLFKGSLNKIYQKLEDGNYGETLENKDLNEILRSVIFGDKEAVHFDRMDAIFEAVKNAPPIEPKTPPPASKKEIVAEPIIEEEMSFMGAPCEVSAASPAAPAASAKELQAFYDFVDKLGGREMATHLKSMVASNHVSSADIRDMMTGLGNAIPVKAEEPAEEEVVDEITRLEAKLNILLGTPDSLEKRDTTTTPPEHKVTLLRGHDWKSDFSIKAPKNPDVLDTSILDVTDSPVQFLVNEHKEGLTEYLKHHDSQVYLISQSKLEKQQEQLASLERDLIAKRDAQKEKFSVLIDLFDSPVALMMLKRETGQKTKPTMEDFLTIWRKDELTKPWAENPLRRLGISELSHRDLVLLDEALREYMATVTELGQLKRTQDAARDYAESIGLFSSTGNPHLAKKYFHLLNAKRHYALPQATSQGDVDYRKLLYMEFRLNFCLRENQLETFRKMLANPNLISQLDMGGGKTSIILPLLAEFMANGENLVTIVLHDALYESNREEMKARNKELFAKPFFCFEFNRDSDLSLETLSTLYKQMLETIDQKGFVVTKKGYKLNFLNTFKQKEFELAEAYKKLENDEITPDLQEKINQFRLLCKIGYLMRTREQAIGDEIDLVAEVRQEVNFALGEAETIDDLKLDLGKEIMHSCMTSSQSVLKNLWENILNNSQASMPEKDRLAAIVELAVIQLDSFNKSSQIYERFDKNELISFAANKTCKPSPEFINALEELKASDVEMYQKLTTLRAFLTVGFATALSKSCDVNYGIDPISNKFVIPYKASNTPSVKSEFDEEIERVSYLLLTYIYKGFTQDVIAKYIKESHQEAIKQKNDDQDEYPTLADTPAAKAFEGFIRRLDPDNTHALRADLKYYDSDIRIKNLLDFINSKTEIKLDLCRFIVMKDMRSLNSQIKSNSEDLASLSYSYGGFTGTPWNSDTYADKKITEKNKIVEGKSWHRLLSKPIEVKVATHNPEDPIGMILESFVVGEFEVLIDTGAYLRGKNNRDFIDAVLAKGKAIGFPIENGVYYNEANEIVCLSQGSKNPVSINAAPATNLKRRVNLYDQPHCTGADLPNFSKARALVTFGEDTFIRDIFQAVWRLRSLNEEQDVVFFMNDKVRDLIMGEKKGIPTVKEILEYALKVQGQRVKEDNWRAEKEKVAGAPSRMMTSILMEMGAQENLNELVFLKTLATFGEHVVQKRQKEEMYDTYATIPTKKEVKEAYKKANHNARKKIKLINQTLTASLEAVGGKDAMDALTSITEKMRTTQQDLKDRPLKHLDRLDDLVSDVTGGTQVHVETQMAVETAVQVEIQQEIETRTLTAVQNPYNSPILERVKPIEFHHLNDLMTGVSGSGRNHVFHPLNRYFSHVDKGLYFTENYQNINAVEGSQPHNSLLLSYRKPVRKIFAVKMQDCPMSLVMGTDHDMYLYMQPYLKHMREQKKGRGAELPVRMAVVGISPTGPLVLDKMGRTSEGLPFRGEDREEFMNLYVQAKFFDGQVHYNKEEKAALKKWLDKCDIISSRRYFELFILNGRADTLKYPKSVLKLIFDQIVEEHKENGKLLDSKTQPKIGEAYYKPERYYYREEAQPASAASSWNWWN